MLGLWKSNGRVFQGLSQMARDVFAVPCTGAGVECEFSKGRRVAPWSRSRLHPVANESNGLFSHVLSLLTTVRRRDLLSIGKLLFLTLSLPSPP